jgi:hypothetical protein
MFSWHLKYQKCGNKEFLSIKKQTGANFNAEKGITGIV